MSKSESSYMYKFTGIIIFPDCTLHVLVIQYCSWLTFNVYMYT